MDREVWFTSVAAVAVAVSLNLVAVPGAQAKDRLRTRAASNRLSRVAPPEYVAVIEKAFDLASYWQLDQAMAQFDQYVPIQQDSKAFRKALSGLYPVGVKSDGAEVVATKELSRRVHIVYVLAYFEARPKLVVLRTYRFKETWRVLDFRFDDDIADLEGEMPVSRVLGGLPEGD